MSKTAETALKITTILWLFIGIVCMPISVSRAELVDRIMAVVNDDIILLSDYEQAAKAYGNTRREGEPALQRPVLSAEERKAVLDQLINDRLTLQQVKRLGIRVSDAEINATIQRIREVNQLSDDAMAKMIELDGLTFEAFQLRIKDQLLQNRLVNLEVKSKVVITDEDVKAYYEANRHVYGGRVKYYLRHILFKFNENAAENEKNRVYQQIKKIHERLEAGEDFSNLAQMYSQAPSAAGGGDLGFFELRLLAPPIRSALEGLNAGELTGIIESEQGYQIFLVDEVQSTGGQSLADASAAIKEKLYAELMEEKFRTWLTELRTKAHIQIME